MIKKVVLLATALALGAAPAVAKGKKKKGAAMHCVTPEGEEVSDAVKKADCKAPNEWKKKE